MVKKRMAGDHAAGTYGFKVREANSMRDCRSKCSGQHGLHQFLVWPVP
jgi:hypothetical protein